MGDSTSRLGDSPSVRLSKSDNGDSHLVTVLGVGVPVAVSGSHEQRIAAIADLQRGRVAWRQLVPAGIAGGVVAP
jgi:hypothetical protein